MRKLEAYREQDEYVLRRTNEFGTTFERRYSKQGFIEALQQYKHHFHDLDKYEIQPSDELWALVINTLSQPDR